MLWSLFSLVCFAEPVFDKPVVVDPPDELQDLVEALESTKRNDAQSRHLLNAGSLLLDERNPEAMRIEAAKSLVDLGDSRALPLFRAAARDRDVDIQVVAVRSALALGDVSVADWLIHDPFTSRLAKSDTVAALSSAKTDGVGELLWRIAGDKHVGANVRSRSRKALRESHPEVIATLGSPRNISNPLGAGLAITANGVAGGVLFSAIGTWGQFESGEAIGAAGGAAIGVGTGALYAFSKPISLSQGLLYASGVGWGLAAGLLATDATYGSPRWQPTSRSSAPCSASPSAATRSSRRSWTPSPRRSGPSQPLPPRGSPPTTPPRGKRP